MFEGRKLEREFNEKRKNRLSILVCKQRPSKPIKKMPMCGWRELKAPSDTFQSRELMSNLRSFWCKVFGYKAIFVHLKAIKGKEKWLRNQHRECLSHASDYEQVWIRERMGREKAFLCGKKIFNVRRTRWWIVNAQNNQRPFSQFPKERLPDFPTLEKKLNSNNICKN